MPPPTHLNDAPRYALPILFLSAAGAAYGAAGDTQLISKRSSGQAVGIDAIGSLSSDGRYVSFSSAANSLVAGDTNNSLDVFVLDRQTAAIERVSVSSSEAQGNAGSTASALSANGRYVVFQSGATNLVPGDTNGMDDIFVRDRQAGVTQRVNLGPSGAQTEVSSDFPAISADGRFVSFTSRSAVLVPNDTNDASDVFVRDRQTGVTERVSLSSSGVQANSFSGASSLSADGRFVAFKTNASNLVNTPGATSQALVRDRLTGSTESVSSGSGDVQDLAPSISADGRYVAFGDFTSILIRDRQTALLRSVVQQGFRVALDSDGGRVTFLSNSTTLVPNDTRGNIDVFTYDVSNGAFQKASVNSAGVETKNDSNASAISGDGRFVLFASQGRNLAPGDSNSVPDAYLHEFNAAPPLPDSPLSVTPLNISFESRRRGTTSPPQLVTITNTTAATAAITGIRLVGRNPNQFGQTSTCGASLAGGASCTVSVVFKPTSQGAKEAVLNVNGGGNGLRAVQLQGTGKL